MLQFHFRLLIHYLFFLNEIWNILPKLLLLLLFILKLLLLIY